MKDSYGIIIAVLGAFCIIFSIDRIISIDPACKLHGYERGIATIFKSYCIKRVDQTDVVVRLKDIK